MDESRWQFAAPAGLTEILLHPLEQPRVGVTWSCRPVEVDDTGTDNTVRSLEFYLTYMSPAS